MITAHDGFGQIPRAAPDDIGLEPLGNFQAFS